MANKTKAQRYNDNADEIFSEYKRQESRKTELQRQIDILFKLSNDTSVNLEHLNSILRTRFPNPDSMTISDVKKFQDSLNTIYIKSGKLKLKVFQAGK